MGELFYKLDFHIDGLEFGPNLSRAEHHFKFGNVNIYVRLPEISDRTQAGTPDPQIYSSEYRLGRDKIRKLVAVNLWKISVLAPVSDFISVGTSCDLHKYSDQDFAEHSDAFEILATKAIDYWARVLRWRLDCSEITLFDYKPRLEAAIPTDVVTGPNEDRVWPKSRGYRSSLRNLYRLDKENWNGIQEFLNKDESIPIWIDFYGFAMLRHRDGDIRASYVDLAISCEARIRHLISQHLPNSIVSPIKSLVQNMRMGDIIRDWTKFGFPTDVTKADIEYLFTIRNKIMHRGVLEEMHASKFSDIARSVRHLF